MFVSLRSSALVCLALCLSTVSPALAGQASPATAQVTQAILPQVPVPDVLDLGGKPQLSGGDADTATPAYTAPATQDADTVSVRTADLTGDLETVVGKLRASDPGNRDLDCLATGIYFESKGEPLAGQLAVGQVIANRASSGGRFPGSYCGVLFQRGQFSFVHGRSLPTVAHGNRQWQTAVAVARIVDGRIKSSVVGKALFFHARYVAPDWHLTRVAAIGNHVFYR